MSFDAWGPRESGGFFLRCTPPVRALYYSGPGAPLLAAAASASSYLHLSPSPSCCARFTESHKAGALIRKAMSAPLSGLENKSDFDLVTDTDKKSEALVIGTSSLQLLSCLCRMVLACSRLVSGTHATLNLLSRPPEEALPVP